MAVRYTTTAVRSWREASGAGGEGGNGARVSSCASNIYRHPLTAHCHPSAPRPACLGGSIDALRPSLMVLRARLLLFVFLGDGWSKQKTQNKNETKRNYKTNRTEEMRAEACRFVSEVADVPYTNTAPGLLQMAFSSFRYHPAKERRRRVHAETIG